MSRAYSPIDIERMKIETLGFGGGWAEAFGDPPRTGVWIIWGNSGNGKSSFAMQLAKELCKYGKVAYNSLEESTSLSMQKTMSRFRMVEEAGRFLLLDREPLDKLSERLSKKRSPDFVIIDSLQYTGINYREYQALKEKHRKKLIIFISHAEGRYPEGRIGKKVMYDADVKILVEGYRAMSKGRFIPEIGACYTIWEEGASAYWGERAQRAEIEDRY